MNASPSLLIVEDDATSRDMLVEALGAEYRVFACSDGDEAIRVFQQESIQLVLCDQRLPGINGLELCRRLRELQPQSVRILITGFSGILELYDAFQRDEIYYYLTKPYNIQQLRMLLRRAAEAQHALSLLQSGLVAGAYPDVDSD